MRNIMKEQKGPLIQSGKYLKLVIRDGWEYVERELLRCCDRCREDR